MLFQVVVALIVIALGKTDGASIAVDRKEPNAETATPVNTTDPSAKYGGPTEEKLDSRMMSNLFDSHLCLAEFN